MSDAVTLTGLQAWVRGFAALIGENKEQLTQLDAAIGDADHGTNMDRGRASLRLQPPRRSSGRSA
jgi:phosphoenolpyruvate---glycerone phosphotransferase subunit DhaL